MASDRETARAQWLEQVKVMRRNERRLAKAFPAVYGAAIDRWLSTGAVMVPIEAQRDLGAVMVRMWRESILAGAVFPIDQEKAAFAKLETKAEAETLFEQIMREFINRFGGYKITQIIETTRDQIMRAIERGVKDGMSVDEIASAMRQTVPALSRTRAHIIARTEVHTAAMHASQEVAKTAIAPLNKRWVSVFDHRTRDFGEGDGIVDEFNHRVMNEVTVGPDELFQVPGKSGVIELMSGPGDPAGSAGNVINCRCALIYRRVGRPWPKTGDAGYMVKPQSVPAVKPAPLRYETFTPSKTMKEAIARMEADVADRVDLPAKASIKMVNETHAAMMEVADRFGIGKAAFVGHHRKAGIKYKWNNGAIAAIDMKRDYYLSAEKGFNHDMIDALLEVSSANKKTHKSWSDKIFASRGHLFSNDLGEAYKKMPEDVFGWSVLKKPRDVVLHEMGHRLHAKHLETLNAMIPQGHADQWGLLISRYGSSNREELIAESFALYMQGDATQFYRIYPPLMKFFIKLDKKAM